jgi:hypothetical protein
MKTYLKFYRADVVETTQVDLAAGDSTPQHAIDEQILKKVES